MRILASILILHLPWPTQEDKEDQGEKEGSLAKGWGSLVPGLLQSDKYSL